MIRASVIIPTRDRASVLEACLGSLVRQTLPKDQFEVLVVDNGVPGSTAPVVDAFHDRLRIRRLEASVPGLHEGRHAGCREARSDVLMFADDDIEAASTWVETVVCAFEDPEVALVGGNNWPLFETEPPEWLRLWWAEPVYRGRALGYLSILDFGSGRFPIDPGYVWGCNFSIRRSVLQTAGGFHPDGMPAEMLRFRGDGESHVTRHLRSKGLLAMFDSAASVHHRTPRARMTMDYIDKRAFAQGVSDSYTAARRQRGPSSQLRGSTAARVRGGIRRLRERWRCRGIVDPAGRQMLEVRLAASRSWYRGFAWHQALLREDASLLRWVLQESYIT